MLRHTHAASLPLGAQLLVAFALIAAILTSPLARSEAALWQVSNTDHNRITIDTNDVIRESFDRDDFFSLNVNYISFQRQLWDSANRSAKGDVEESLGAMAGIRYRYPGGMVANGYLWNGAIGDIESRRAHKNIYGKESLKPKFGLDEYLDLMDRIGGNYWYVLNLVGLHPDDPFALSAPDAVAASNAELVEYLLDNDRYAADDHYFQLGNELDRSKHEWTYDMYIERSRATMDAILEVDPSARFVAFLRAFAYKYKKDKSRGKSTPEELMERVLTALPEIEDYSLMQYYDSTRTDGKSWSIPFWAERIAKTIDNYRRLKDGDSPRVWITEHARQASSNRPGSDDSRVVTSNLGASISSADYLSMLVQIPEVAGAFWHGLNAGPWRLFDVDVLNNDLGPRPIYHALNLLRDASRAKAYATRTESKNDGDYAGGYDVRAAAFGDDAGELSLWVVNRTTQPNATTVSVAEWANRAVTIEHKYIGGRAGLSPDDPDNKPQLELTGTIIEKEFSQEGEMTLELPPASVSTFVFKRDE